MKFSGVGISVVGMHLMIMCLAACPRTSVNSPGAHRAQESREELLPPPALVQVAFERIKPGEMFSVEDKTVDYDLEKSALVQLTGSSAKSKSSAVQINGNIVKIVRPGFFRVEGALKGGQIVINNSQNGLVHLALNGMSISNNSTSAILVEKAERLLITLVQDSTNTLSSDGHSVGKLRKSNAVISAQSSVSVKGTGTLILNSKFGSGIYAKQDLIVTGGTFKIRAHRHGLFAKSSVRITHARLRIHSGKDGIHSKNKRNFDQAFVYLERAHLDISAGDDGIFASNSISVKSGEINIMRSHEGMESPVIDISGGNIDIRAEDDGINISNRSYINARTDNKIKRRQSSAGQIYLRISGGTLTIDSQGDGIDSNGSVYVSGGKTYINSAAEGSECALDFDDQGKITGGTFIGVGASRMAQNFEDGSTQGSILVNFDEETSGKVKLLDSGLRSLASFSPLRKYLSVVVSHPAVKIGHKYILKAGRKSYNITMSEITVDKD